MKKEKERLVVGVMVVFFWLIKATIGSAPMALPGCLEKCGNVTIPYPFGIGSNCSANNTFTITCNSSNLSEPKPFLSSINLEVLKIRFQPSIIRVNSPVTKSDCPTRGISTGPRPYLNLSATPFSFNTTDNIFTWIGCDSEAQLFDDTTNQGTVIAGCVSTCSNGSTGRLDSGCYGINCCQTIFPPISSKVVTVSLSSIAATTTSSSRSNNTSGCNYGFLVEEEWFRNLTDPFAMEGRENIPLVLDWTTDEYCYYNEVCENGYSSFTCDGDRTYCSCYREYEGNPYFQNGCLVRDRCDNSTMCGDNMICENRYGYRRCEFRTKSKTVMFAIIGIGSGLGGLFLVTGAWWSWKIIKRRKKAKLKKKFFKRNGGLLLHQQLTSAEQGYVEKTKVFTSKELEKATDGYNANRILGQGGQGTVYKGMLTDGKIVAIKKSKIVDEEKLEEFINEVVILSQINHRNVVKLHGCCLETEVPMLVYDFIPNGTLFQYIHHQQNEDFPLSWDVRLRIASEVAEALSYLHSAASQPIYHRDIKSTNILLDDKYRAKVADFGTSRSTDIDQTHMTTRVQGTFGYLDPEYFQSSQFTAKSDVYSFGVVLLELLTGQKAVLPITFEEGRSLATYFMFSMKENRLFDILDAQVLEEGGKEEINGVANLARRCLNLNGKKRPTMKEVAMELEAIRISPRASIPSQEHYEEVDDHSIIELARPWDTASSSITSWVEDKPLLFN